MASVARFVEATDRTYLGMIGYDFLEKNIAYLDNATIDFLICQKPEEQAYRGSMALYQHLVRSAKVACVHHTPIDIITKENYKFYSN